MDRELTPEEIKDLLPAYAIDAVDDDERAAIDAYLDTDDDARDEVASIQRAASFLAHTGGPAARWRVGAARSGHSRAAAPRR